MLVEELKRLDPDISKYKHIGVSELIDMLDVSRGSQFISTLTMTVPEYRKSGCPWRDNIYKLNRRVYHINSPYAQMVNNQRKREELAPNFKSLPRTWGGRLIGPPFVVNLKEGNLHLYLEGKVHSELGHQFITKECKHIRDDDINPFLRVRTSRPRQGVENSVEIRNIMIEHILTIHVKQKGYILNV